MKHSRKQSLILLLIIFVAVMGIGYAFITTTLNIDGTTDIDSSSWNIYWNNVKVTEGSVSGDKVTKAPTIDPNDKTFVNFYIRLSEPGEYYEFTIDAVNDGSIDAMIDEIAMKINGGNSLPDYLIYIVTYSDGNIIEENHLLSAGDKHTYKVRIQYRDDIPTELLPATYHSLNITFDITYIQATSLAIPISHYVYTNTFATGYTLGGENHANAVLYNSPREVIDATGKPFFLRNKMNNDNKIIEMAVGFEYYDKIYYLEYDKPYETEKALLYEVFGDYCSETNESLYKCRVGQFYTQKFTSGSVYAGIYNDYFCTIYDNGNTGLCWND